MSGGYDMSKRKVFYIINTNALDIDELRSHRLFSGQALNKLDIHQAIKLVLPDNMKLETYPYGSDLIIRRSKSREILKNFDYKIAVKINGYWKDNEISELSNGKFVIKERLHDVHNIMINNDYKEVKYLGYLTIPQYYAWQNLKHKSKTDIKNPIPKSEYTKYIRLLLQ